MKKISIITAEADYAAEEEINSEIAQLEHLGATILEHKIATTSHLDEEGKGEFTIVVSILYEDNK